MKTSLFSILTLLFVSSLFLSTTFAEDFSSIVLEGHTGVVNSVAFSPDGKTLTSGARSPDNSILLWVAMTGTLTGHPLGVTSTVFSPDGRTLASGSEGLFEYDDTIRLWDAESTTHKHILTGHTANVKSVAFSPDGKTLASGSLDKTIRLWKLP